MWIWSIAAFCLIYSFYLLLQELKDNRTVFGFSRKKSNLLKIIRLLRELEETLLAGLVPPAQRWEDLKSLQEPWGSLSHESLTRLRESGGALLPTLRRLRSLAEDQCVSLQDARAKSSQAFAQAGACAALVPLLGLGLYWLVPSLENHIRSWLVACSGALVISGIGAIWLIRLAERARWGGLSPDHRIWILGAQVAGERFLAAVRCGTPPDLAWTQAVDSLKSESLELAVAWGHSVWDPELNRTSKIPTENVILQSGSAIKKSVQISLMEGRPCTERVESTLFALRKEVSSYIERELSLLSTRALKPLFIFVAPALMGLLFFGLWLTAQDTLQDSLKNTFLNMAI